MQYTFNAIVTKDFKIVSMYLDDTGLNGLTLPMLRLLFPKAQGRNDFRKPSKLYHVAVRWIALAKYFQMSTHVLGFQSFFSFFASFCIGQIIHQRHKG